MTRLNDLTLSRINRRAEVFGGVAVDGLTETIVQNDRVETFAALHAAQTVVAIEVDAPVFHHEATTACTSTDPYSGFFLECQHGLPHSCPGACSL